MKHLSEWRPLTGWQLYLVLGTVIFFARYMTVFALHLPFLIEDTIQYFKMAQAILDGQPIGYFPNGYPLLIAFLLLFSERADVYQQLLWINIIASTAIALFAIAIAHRHYNRLAAIGVGAIICVWPNQLNYVRQLLTEVPSTFFFVLAIGLSGRWMFWSGLSFWIAAFIRSTLWPVAPLYSLYLIGRGRILHAFYVLAGFLVGHIFNIILLHFGVIAPSDNLSFNFLVSIGSDSISGTVFSIEQFSEFEKANPVRAYLAFASSHPFEFLYQRWAALWELWGFWPQRGTDEEARSILTCILIGLRFPVLILALAEIWRRRDNELIVVIALAVFTLTAIHMMFFSSPRFTYPVEPLVLILAVGWLSQYVATSQNQPNS